MNQADQADQIPWDQKTPEQKAKCVTDHLAHEFASGNLRPISEGSQSPQGQAHARQERLRPPFRPDHPCGGPDRSPPVRRGVFPRAELGLLEHWISRTTSRRSLFSEVDSPARPRDFWSDF